MPKFDETVIKEISIVPDYKALEIIQANKRELESFLSEGDPIIADICKQPTYVSFQKCLTDVEEYLSKRQDKQVVKLDAEKASSIGRDLTRQLKCTREEVVMLLNMLPLNDSILEMMFPGRFNKEDTVKLMAIVNEHLGVVGMAVVEGGEEIATPVKKEEVMDEDWDY